MAGFWFSVFPPPSTVLRDCSCAVCDGEVKLGMTDATFKPDIMTFTLFSGHVRSLIHGAISKPPHDHKMSQLCIAAYEGQSFSGR